MEKSIPLCCFLLEIKLWNIPPKSRRTLIKGDNSRILIKIIISTLIIVNHGSLLKVEVFFSPLRLYHSRKRGVITARRNAYSLPFLPFLSFLFTPPLAVCFWVFPSSLSWLISKPLRYHPLCRISPDLHSSPSSSLHIIESSTLAPLFFQELSAFWNFAYMISFSYTSSSSSMYFWSAVRHMGREHIISFIL